MEKIVIIGSGLSSYSAVLACLKQNITPTVIDIGETFMQNSNLAKRKIAHKTKFGSDYMYDLYDLENVNDFLPVSGALGGFSTIWGAGLQPWLDRSDYPKIVNQEIKSAEKSILENIPINVIPDNLQNKLPLHIPSNATKFKYQTEIFRDLLNRVTKKNLDILIGHPRLAIRFNNNLNNFCTLCRKCLYGCEYNAIFDAGDEFSNWISTGKIKYVKERLISIDNSNPNFLKLNLLNSTLISNSVFIGAGPISTARILLESNLVQDTITIKDSKVLYFVFLNLNKKFKNTINSIELAQLIFIKLNNHDLKNKCEFAGSLYANSTGVLERFHFYLKKFLLPNFLIKLFLILTDRYLISSISFIHSDYSGVIEVNKLRNSKISINKKKGNLNNKKIKSFKKLVIKNFIKLNLLRLPMPPFINSEVGDGFHIGASLPLGGKIINFDGALKIEKRVHVIDASILPTIESGSHSLSVMANSYRVMNNYIIENFRKHSD